MLGSKYMTNLNESYKSFDLKPENRDFSQNDVYSDLPNVKSSLPSSIHMSKTETDARPKSMSSVGLPAVKSKLLKKQMKQKQ